MVVLPSPYAYAWFEAPREYNLEVKVGCKDPNSVDYCEDCQVEDNSRCGPCNAGWTKINDPNMKCWAVGSMTVDCAAGTILCCPTQCYMRHKVLKAYNEWPQGCTIKNQ